MKAKKLKLPAELQAFIDKGNTTLHCDDGDWDFRIEAREDSPFRNDIPARSIMIAENGCGDCLFLKTSGSGKIDAKVFVYWHEEERHELFTKHVKELTETRKPGSPADESSAVIPSMSLAQLETALASSERLVRANALREFEKTTFGVEALPVLKKALESDDMMVAIYAANCIGKLGPVAIELENLLMHVGSKTWGYSLYPNCYSACLEALLKLKVEDAFLVEYVCDHIGLSNPDDLLHSLNALKEIGTPDAINLLKRAATFWLPELNMKYAKEVKTLAATARPRKK